MSNPLKNNFTGQQINPQMAQMFNNPQMQLVAKLMNSPVGQLILPILQGQGISPKQLMGIVRENPQYLIQLLGKTQKGAELINKAQNVLAGRSANDLGQYAMQQAKQNGITEEEFRQIASQLGIKV